MKLQVLTPREASIFACVADTLLAPEPDLPAVRDTTTAAGFDSWLARSPAMNRLGVRAGLLLLELSPMLAHGRRFRSLTPTQRRSFLIGADKRKPLWITVPVDTLRMLAAISYYSDDGVALRLGYDAEARLARGRELRAAEGRP